MANIVPDFLSKIFARNANALGWKWVLDTHVIDAEQNPVPLEPAFGVRQDYVVLRLSEMYLRQTRRLWRQYYPMVYSFVAYGDPAAQRSLASTAGPGQLKDLGSDNLDRLIGLAYRLAGPLVYDGQDIELLAGLYAVPAHDGAKLMIDTLSQLSGLVPALKQATDVASILKGGIEGLLGMSGANLALGIHDALRAPGAGAGRAASPGFIIAFNAPAASIDENQLWIRSGRLCQGPNPITAVEFDATDAMVFELHRGPSRATGWATLPALAGYQTGFDAALKETEGLARRINELYRDFELALDRVDELTDPDKSAVRAIVADELRKRVETKRGGGLIEEKSAGGQTAVIDPDSFRPADFADLPSGAPLPARASGQPVI